MIKIAIVEDETDQATHIQECISEYVRANNDYQVEVKRFPTGSAFLLDFNSGVFDIILMDIEMPGVNGLETARQVRKKDANTIIVFITRLAQFAINGYDVNAYSYILKPLNKVRFISILGNVLSIAKRRQKFLIPVRTDRETIMLDRQTIMYIEIDGHLLCIHTDHGNLQCWCTLNDMEQKLSSNNFVRCNNHTIINLYFVRSFMNDQINIAGTDIPISRGRKKETLERMASIIGE